MNVESNAARQRGVTLIELMTVVVVVAVLAAIAIPSYRIHVMRSRRSEATAALLQLQAAQEKFYLQQGRYTDNLAAPAPTGLGLTGRSANGAYDLSVALNTDPSHAGDQSYTATARAVGGGGQTADTQCASFTLTDAGLRGASGSAGIDTCWR